jgi:glycosyltransferase involved in cell wall biosynthesis
MLSANDGTMNILQILTYYRPHISGLTIYVERLSKAFAKQGHSVTVLTSQYDKNLPLVEATEGVVIQRVPVAFRVSKGVIMPSFGPTAWRMVRWADIIHLQTSSLDLSFGSALTGWII